MKTKDDYKQWFLSRGADEARATLLANEFGPPDPPPPEPVPGKVLATAMSGVQTKAVGEKIDAMVQQNNAATVAQLQQAYAQQAAREAEREARDAACGAELKTIAPLRPGATDLERVKRAKAVETVLRKHFPGEFS